MLTTKEELNSLFFQEQPEEIEIHDDYTTVAYGLYNRQGSNLGTCIWSEDYYPNKQKELWYLCNIFIKAEFQNKGYGTELLKRSCEKMWSNKKIPIVLVRAGDAAGYRREWFIKRGFQEYAPNSLFMIHYPDDWQG